MPIPNLPIYPSGAALTEFRNTIPSPQEWDDLVGLYVKAIYDAWSQLQQAVVDVGAAAAVSANFAYRNLVILAGDEARADTETKVRITADEIGIEGVIVQGVDITADITADLDTGTLAANTKYPIWLGTNGVGGVKVLLSEAFLRGDLTLDAGEDGYEHWRRVGALRTNGSSELYRIIQRGARVDFDHSLTEMQVLTDGTSGTIAPIDCSPFVPPTARTVHLAAYGERTSGSDPITISLHHGDTLVTGIGPAILYADVAHTSFEPRTLALDADQRCGYAIGSGNAKLQAYVPAYEDAI